MKTKMNDHKKQQKCEIRWCKSGLPADRTSTEVIGDGAFSVDICSICKALFGDLLPEPNEVEKILKKENKRNGFNHETKQKQ